MTLLIVLALREDKAIFAIKSKQQPSFNEILNVKGDKCYFNLLKKELVHHFIKLGGKADLKELKKLLNRNYLEFP